MNNPLDRIPAHDRVSLRAVIVPDGVDPGPALAQAGITEPIALPILFGENYPDATFGDGFTPNLTAALEYDPPDAFGSDRGDAEVGSDDRPLDRRAGDASPDPGAARSADTSQLLEQPTTINLPAAYGTQPLAPVRPAVRLAQPVRATPPSPSGFVQPETAGRTEA